MKKERPKWAMPFQGMPQLREPAEESTDIYSGLVVHDGRVCGSITAGQSRLPLWCLIPDVVDGGFKQVAKQWEDLHGLTQEGFSDFLYNLLEQRGDFARLLLVLADVERQETEMEKKDKLITVSWWYHPEMKERVREALQRCLDVLNQE
jgi:hypothetical protein